MKQKMIFLILAVLLIVFLSAYFLFPRETKSLAVQLKVGDVVGINLDTDAIYFGTIAPNGRGERDIFLNTSYSAFVLITKEGELSRWVDVPLFVFLKKGKRVTVSVDVPSDAEVGNYTGKLNLRFYNMPFFIP